VHIVKNHILLYISMRRTPMKISGWRGVLHCIRDFPLSYASAVEKKSSYKVWEIRLVWKSVWNQNWVIWPSVWN